MILSRFEIAAKTPGYLHPQIVHHAIIIQKYFKIVNREQTAIAKKYGTF
jgi:hypothetical protein